MRKKALIIPFQKIKTSKKYFKNKKTVLVGGCFDLIHFGHLQFLKKAKACGDFLIVALESDEFIKKNKRKSPIHSQEERAEVLSSLNFVDLVIKIPYFSANRDYFEMVNAISPKIVAVTDGDPQLENKKKQVELIGGQLKIVTALLRKFSTRKIISDFN